MPLDLRHVAWDSCSLFGSFDRRFIMAACELSGCQTNVLPQVAKEMFGILSGDTAKYWLSVMEGEERRGGSRYGDDEKARICEAASEGLKAWVKSEIDAQATQPSSMRSLSGLKLHILNPAEVGRALDIASKIPAYCFQGTPKDGHWGDRQIMGQAIVSGLHVLASRNRNSIKRARLNRWCQEAHGINGDIIVEADDVMQQIMTERTQAQGADAEVGPGDEMMLKAVLLAAMPGHDVAPDRFDSIIETFIQSIEKSRTFIECADSARRTWLSRRGKACVDEIKPMLADSVARATEQRRIDSVRRSASDAGWRGGP